MYASLLFPSAPVAELPVSVTGEIGSLFAPFSLTEEEIRILSAHLTKTCESPEVLAYRARFSEELYKTPSLAALLEELGALGKALPREIPTPEGLALRTVARFEHFSDRFDRFRAKLKDLLPESDAARRLFRFLKLYGDSYEYKELRRKAEELIRSFRFEEGLCLAPSDSGKGEGTAHLFRADREGSMAETLFRVMDEFSLPRPEETPQPAERYTDTEAAVLTEVIRSRSDLSRRLSEFFDLYRACGTEDILRLSKEAELYSVFNKLWHKGREMGFSLCRPIYRPLGYFCQIKDLSFCSESPEPSETPDAPRPAVSRADFIATPRNRVTVVCGPDAARFLRALTLAHLSASAGGLVFAESAEISPILRLEQDEKGQLHTASLDEHSLCICGNLFDAMLPRQEEAALQEVLRRLTESGARSALRICGKSNLTALEKAAEEGTGFPCTLLTAGTDRTLEELLKRHNLTEESQEEHHD